MRYTAMPNKNYEPFSIILDSRLMEALSERSTSMTRVQALIDLVSRRASGPTDIKKHDQIITLQPGEADTSLHLLAEEWGWDRKTVRRFLKLLNDCGVITTRQTTFAAISTFPSLVDSSTAAASELPLKTETGSPASQTSASSPELPVPSDPLPEKSVGSVRYDMGPLNLTEAERLLLKEVYDKFRSLLPRLDLPAYNDRTEKAIYYLFVLGMHEDHALLDRFLDVVARDPMMNGEMAELSGDPRDKETFVSLFSSRWQELLFPDSVSQGGKH